MPGFDAYQRVAQTLYEQVARDFGPWNLRPVSCWRVDGAHRDDRAALGRVSGAGRRGCWSHDRVPPEFEQVVGAAQQLPLHLARAKPPAHEPPGALLLFDLPEDRLDGLLALGVAGLALLAGELGGHHGAQPVAL